LNVASCFYLGALPEFSDGADPTYQFSPESKYGANLGFLLEFALHRA
jgi:hypothetical protein